MPKLLTSLTIVGGISIFLNFPIWVFAQENPTDKARSCSEQHKNVSASFTLVWQKDTQPEFSSRYDVSTKQWIDSALVNSFWDKDSIRAIQELKAELGKPGGLVPEGIFDTISQPVFLREENQQHIYSFVPNAEGEDDPMLPKMSEAIEAQFSVDPSNGCLSNIQMKSFKPFKPAPVAKIDSFLFAYRFNQPEGSPIPLLSSFQTSVSGRAMFKTFDETLSVEIRDVVIEVLAE